MRQLAALIAASEAAVKLGISRSTLSRRLSLSK